MLRTFHGRLFRVSDNRNFEKGKRNERNARRQKISENRVKRGDKISFQAK